MTGAHCDRRATGAMGALCCALMAVVSTGSGTRAAEPEPLAMRGQVFVDFDRDGMIDRGETELAVTAGLDVTVVDGGRTTTESTGDDGSFFAEVSGTADLVRVEFDTPPGYRSTFVQQLGEIVPDAGPAVQFVEFDRIESFAYGIVPDSRCPDDPAATNAPSGAFPSGNPNSASGKIWSACFVDGAAENDGGANDVLVGANLDASGWDPSDPESGFGGNLDVEHLATRSEMGAIWGVAYDEWDGVLFTSAVIKRHSGLGPEGVDGIYWRTVDDAELGVVQSVGLDSLSPADAPSFGPEPVACAGSGDEYPGFDLAATATGGSWDCRDVDRAEAGGQSHDWWAYDRTGRAGIGDIDTTPAGDRLVVVNATADAVFVYDIADDGAPSYAAHHTITDPGCRGGGFEAWGTTASDSVDVLVGVTCTASVSNDAADLSSHVVLVDIETGMQSSIVEVGHDHPHGAGYTTDANPGAGRFRPWLDRAVDGSLQLPPIEEAASIRFRDFLEAYAYSNGWEWHQPLLSDIEVDPIDGSLVLGIMDRWSMMTGVFNCGLVPNDSGCGVEHAAPPAGDYDGLVGDDPVDGYTAGIVGYVAGDLLRVCNTNGDSTSVRAAELVVEGGAGCEIPELSPTYESEVGGGPAGDREWYWNDQAFSEPDIDNVHPEAAQGAVFIAHRSSDVTYTAMNPIETFGAGLSTDSNRDGTHQRGLQFFRTDFRNSDGTGWKSASLGDVDGCSIPLEVGGFVWFDDDADGVRGDETGFANVRVSLIESDSGVVVGAAQSGPDGSYLFSTPDGLQPDTDYLMRFDVTEMDGLDDLDAVDSLDDLAVTVSNAELVRDDVDSDAEFDDSSSRPEIRFTTGAPGDNDHTLSAGFARRADVEGSPLGGGSAEDALATDGERRKQDAPTLRIWIIAIAVLAGLIIVGGLFFRWLWSRPA